MLSQKLQGHFFLSLHSNRIMCIHNNAERKRVSLIAGKGSLVYKQTTEEVRVILVIKLLF